MADERTRYSDAELEEFKQLILKKLENARADYELLRATITRHTADNDTEDTSPDVQSPRRGAQRPSLERGERTSGGTPDEIHTESGDGLVRIENKTYGICKTTGKLSSQGAADESAACHRVHRSQRGGAGKPAIRI